MKRKENHVFQHPKETLPSCRHSFHLTRLEQITPYVAVGEKIFGGGFLLLAGYYFYQGWRYVQVLSP